ncbi:MAG: hypothetical protein K8H88_27465 [Sandaracinaceae bacterium]|nr:hypothetical protein [Sandaracinaceae bacterium]
MLATAFCSLLVTGCGGFDPRTGYYDGTRRSRVGTDPVVLRPWGVLAEILADGRLALALECPTESTVPPSNSLFDLEDTSCMDGARVVEIRGGGGVITHQYQLNLLVSYNLSVDGVAERVCFYGAQAGEPLMANCSSP